MTYQFSGIVRGIVFTEHGLFGKPFQFLPKAMLRSARGSEMKAHDTNTVSIVPNGIAASKPKNIATVLSMKPVPKHINANNDAL